MDIPKRENIQFSSQGGTADPADEADQDREYGCKYCTKKFSNKQALGGHQNAHKMQRAMERSVREVQENHFAYFSRGGFSYLTPRLGPYLGSYNRSHDYLNRAVMYRPYPSTPMALQNQVVYNPHAGLEMAGEPSLPREVPRFNNVYTGTGMTRPMGGLGLTLGQGSGYVGIQGFNSRASAVGSGSSSYDIDDSGLDLELKL